MWEWGDVATWFTGMVTAGSLWLAILLLRNDRMDKERAQASRLVIRTRRERHQDKTWSQVVELINASDGPFMQIGLTVFILPSKEISKSTSRPSLPQIDD